MKTLPTPSSRIKAPALVASAMALLALPAGAATIAVTNHSFESNSVGDGSFVTGATGWTVISNNPGQSNGVTYNPPTSWFSTAGGNNTPTGGDGRNVFSVSVNAGLGFVNVYRGLSQRFAATDITAGTIYTMTVAVGDFLGRAPLDFQLDLAYFDGTTNVILASYFGAAAVLTDDRLNDFSVSFTALPGQAYLGQDLVIQIRGDQRADGLGQNVAFDNVRLTSEIAIPETSTALLGGLGLMVLLRRRR